METTNNNKGDGHLKFIQEIAQEDAAGLIKAHESYGDSWKKRGGIGAYMVMIRKFDRMENGVRPHGFDIVKAVKADQRPEGLIDDIRDARRYLLLIESWLRELGLTKAGDHRDNQPKDRIHRVGSKCTRMDALLQKTGGHTKPLWFDVNNPAPVQLSLMSHPAGCDCQTCGAVRHAELKARAKKRLYEDNPHPAGCDCDTCSADRRADRRLESTHDK